MKTTLSTDLTSRISERLGQANAEFASRFPGESGNRQPVHTVYGGAHLFKSDSAARLGAVAARTLEQYAPDAAGLANAVGLPDGLGEVIHDRVREKLLREPVEDFRIDFEDGYGHRSDEEEDHHAAAAAGEVARGMQAGTLPPFVGIRIKPFTEELRARSVRTLDLFLTALIARGDSGLPPNFVVTLPKVVMPEQVVGLADLCDLLEPRLGLGARSMKFELMVETTQSIINHRGECNLPHFVEAARGRCVAMHFGVYDYTASCSITAAHQNMVHPACDFARHVMQVSLGGTGIWLSDGATNVMPVGPHRAGEAEPLSPQQSAENRAVVHRAWRLHYEHVQHSLRHAFYQGWDLHPAQFPTRYAAVYAFFLDGLDAAADRLRNFVEKAAKATLIGDIFDDAATGQGLLNFFLRAINCGAISAEEAEQRTSLSLEELQTASFLKILRRRAATD
jgi:citrate lyase beta subunit